ncbi:MAG: ParB/RepB/Spo0J family partition protein [Oribacterium sp.]|nr:ParB/RepB/Spo0J family partition protein [Oribacterium sp.]
MPKKGANISLNSYDDIFRTEEDRRDTGEHVIMVDLEKIHPFKNHPFKVVDDEEMQKTADSIRQYGVLVPAIVRPLESGEYEMISGHRRRYASMLAGKETMPVIVREMDDDTATILMVDSNLQRENILPSERAKAYQMKMEALKHQGERKDLQKGDEGTCRQVVDKLKVADAIGKETGESGRQVQRYMRLNNLIPELLDMVDDKKLAFNPAVELSYLKPEEQQEFLQAMDEAQTTPSLSQAQRMKKASQEGKCSPDMIREVMEEQKKNPMERVVFDTGELRKYFPKSYTPKQMQQQILKLLDQWTKKRDRNQER